MQFLAYKSPGTIYHTNSRNEKRERGGEPDQPVRAEQVKALPDMMLLIRFIHGEVRLFDASIPEGPAFEPLHDEQIFASPVIDHGAVPWKDRETDCAPLPPLPAGPRRRGKKRRIAGRSFFLLGRVPGERKGSSPAFPLRLRQACQGQERRADEAEASGRKKEGPPERNVI